MYFYKDKQFKKWTNRTWKNVLKNVAIRPLRSQSRY